jgi:hypothetical protein
MSSTGHATTSHSHFRLITDALVDYTNVTGTDLSQNPFAEKFQQAHTADDILELLQEREKAFAEYRDGNRRLLNCISPAVHVLHVFSATLGEVIGQVRDTRLISLLHFFLYLCTNVVMPLCQVPFSPAKAVFIGIDVLLTVRSSVSDFRQISSDNAWLFRLPRESVQAMTPFSISLNAWAVS